ncbi:hypothetical protein B0H11DRAFT_2284422 [Mycena galericulata]|nr:hypothetical protein B0H11DRAFT_2284422 [Mycena galericulata]
MSQLDSLANELRAHICSFQNHYNLTVLTRVNKSWRGLIEPMLYSQVELHRPGYHEYYRYPSELDVTPHEHRNYDCGISLEYEGDWYAAERVYYFMKLFEDTAESDGGHPRARREALAEHVRFLCLDFSLDKDGEHLVDPLGIFACFQNLGHLELVMNWPWNHRVWDAAVQAFVAKSRSPLVNLRMLRLRGYVPKEFVQYLCQGTTGIADLELAVLDRPIGSILCNERLNPLPGWKHNKSEVDGDAWLDGEGDDEVTAEDSDAEDFEHEECIAPRALAALLGAVDLPKQFPCLTHLRLCRPAESQNEGFQDVFVSVASDVAILKEWAALIRATRGTLQHLVLDQRPFAEEIEQDSTGDEEYLRGNPYGPGYDRFIKHALPALLEDGVEWPSLKSVHLHGFDVPPKDVQEGRDMGEPQRLLAVVGSRFEPLGVDVRSDLGRRMLYEDDDGLIRRGGDGFGGRRWDLEDNE